jgi:hypothetical protein
MRLERADCPVCGRDVALIDEGGGRYRVRAHGRSHRRGTSWSCRGTDMAAVPREVAS